MGKIRVLIVDDSAVIRRVLTQALASDGEIEVVGVAANGKIALERIQQTPPDVVVLDVEMPELDGLSTLEQIRANYKHLPVIMYSTQTHRGAYITIRALLLGANDYVHKHSDNESLEEAIRNIQRDLIPRIKAVFKKNETVKQEFKPAKKNLVANGKIDVLAIGSSTGGPNALLTIIQGLPKNLPVPVLIVQHMPPMFTQMLANQLNAQYGIKVIEAFDGVEIQNGCAYVAPGDYHMELRAKNDKTVIALNQNPPENSCRPSVDVTFRSVADFYGSNILAVILTGMGQDGLRGCERIRENGGRIIAQDEKTSVVWGMPGAVARAGLADEILPVTEIAPAIIRIISDSRPLWFPVFK
ncbi:MAG: protein-glutamate methylesterase/protein-glutamine glutaminase [Verrucomicrobiia bacterium]